METLSTEKQLSGSIFRFIFFIFSFRLVLMSFFANYFFSSGKTASVNVAPASDDRLSIGSLASALPIFTQI